MANKQNPGGVALSLCGGCVANFLRYAKNQNYEIKRVILMAYGQSDDKKVYAGKIRYFAGNLPGYCLPSVVCMFSIYTDYRDSQPYQLPRCGPGSW